MEDDVKNLLIGVLICVAIVTLAGGQDVTTPRSIERTFAEGGLIALRLSSGDYTIRAGRSDRIAVRWEPEKHSDASKMKNVSVVIETSNSTATIRTDGPTKNARITIEVPAKSNLDLKVFAGDVRVQNIEGDKEIKMSFGDLQIDANPAAYSRVSASVKVGDLNAGRFHVSKDGFGPGFEWQGGGAYRLHARLFAGDLTLN